MSCDITAAKRQLYRLSQLPPNWDMNGCRKYSERILSHARYLLAKLPKVPNIYPNSDKSLLFSYGDSDNFLELELFEDSTVKVLYKNTKGEYKIQNTTVNRVSDWFKYLFPEETKNESSAG